MGNLAVAEWEDGQLEMIISTLFSFCLNDRLFSVFLVRCLGVCIDRRGSDNEGGGPGLDGIHGHSRVMRRDMGCFFLFSVYFYIWL